MKGKDKKTIQNVNKDYLIKNKLAKNDHECELYQTVLNEYTLPYIDTFDDLDDALYQSSLEVRRLLTDELMGLKKSNNEQL